MPSWTHRRRTGPLRAGTASLALTLVAAGTVAAGLLATGAASAAEAGVHVGGPVTTNTTWTAAGGPYVIDSPVQVADNITLTVEPGARVYASAASNAQGRSSTVFEVVGTLDIAGTAANPVVIDGDAAGTGMANGFIGTLTASTDAEIRVSHAIVSDFDGFAPPTGNPGHANYTLTDSVFTNMPTYSYFWYPTAHATLARNLFVNVGTLTFGTGRDAVAEVTNNRFRGVSTSGYAPYLRAVESWAAYGQPLQLHGNTFEPATGQQYAVAVSIDGVIDGSGNDWGTTDPTAVKARIYDQEDDLTRPSTVTTDPLLTGPAAATPSAPPTQPRNVTAVPSDASLTATWAAPELDGGATVTGYQVTATAAGAAPVTVAVPGTATTADITGLTNGTAYRVTVTATNSAGPSAPSLPSQPATPSGVPDAPAGVGATAADRSAVIHWTAAAANGSPVTSYTVTASPGGATQTVSGSANQTTFTGLENGETYTFTVTATNANGSSAPSQPSAAVVPVGKPGKPGKPTAKVTGTKVTLTWTPADPNGAAVVAYKVMTVSGPTRPTATTKRTKVTLKGLKPGRYRFTVKAVNSTGAGKASQPVKVRVR